jgi:hypothetical protein
MRWLYIQSYQYALAHAFMLTIVNPSWEGFIGWALVYIGACAMFEHCRTRDLYPLGVVLMCALVLTGKAVMDILQRGGQ